VISKNLSEKEEAMSGMKVFVRKDHTKLYTSRKLKEPTLLYYVYEYPADDDVVEYWNSLNPEEQQGILCEAQIKKRDLRGLIKEKQRRKPTS
jgi:hypothetical protein